MQSLMEQSPYGIYLEHIKKGELTYQVNKADGRPVFYPRAVAPKTGGTDLEWKVSTGLGTVYATTVVYYKNELPLNVALIDLDEGFRMMSRVEDIDPLEVRIGMRVKVRMHPGDEKQPPYPVFTPTLTPDPSPKGERGADSSPSPLGRRERDEGRGGAK